MSISGISGGLPPILAAQPQAAPSIQKTGAPEGPGFSERISGAVKELAASQTQATESARAFEQGLETDLASVMVDQQVASLGFQMALNVRNKALGAYRDIMNMPV